MAAFDWPGKSATDDHAEHPALYHMIDVGAVAERLLAPLSLPGPLKEFYALCAALHDLGKISDSFRNMIHTGAPQSAGRHWEVTEVWLRKFDAQLIPLAEDRFDRLDIYAAIAGHHGRPPVQEEFSRMIAAAGQKASRDASEMIEILKRLWPEARFDLPYEAIPAQTWWLPGLIAVADWIGSNPGFFPAVIPGPDAVAYWEQAREKAAFAVDKAGLASPAPSREPIIPADWTLRPMQEEAQKVQFPDGPVLALIEDETGSGKTEAALILAQRLMQEGKGLGIFFALPTMATANAMFDRVADLVAGLFETPPSLALAHGRAGLSPRFRDLVRASASPNMPDCTEWLADDRRRALLATVGVGTVDQALLSALPVRHAMLRHYALSQKILIVDEVHEMGEPYMIEEVCRLLSLHRRMGGSAILMTATLPVAQRRRLCEAFGCDGPDNPAYPALTIAGHTQVRELPSAGAQQIDPDNRRGPVAVQRLPDADRALTVIEDAIAVGAAVLWVRNAVDDAIAAVDALLSRGITADLLHARFALCDRLLHEQSVLQAFGKERPDRPGRVLVATQVVESSLDLDFDVMVSDLAPVPALVQRAGRLWRHMDRRPKAARPVSDPILHVVSPDPDVVTDAAWLARVLDRGAYTYPVGLQWRSARALFAVGRIDAPEGLRDLIEGSLSDDPVPEALQKAEDERVAKGYVETALARQNLVPMCTPYREIKGFSDDADFPTRLGVEQRTLILARTAVAGVVPLSGGAWTAEARQRSEVSAAAHKLTNLPLPDQTAPEVGEVKQFWPEWQRARFTVCPVGADGRICDGLSYDPERGLLFG